MPCACAPGAGAAERLAHDHRAEDRVGHQVALPEPPWLLQDAVEPLETQLLPQPRRAAGLSRQHVERPPDAVPYPDVEALAPSGEEALLARRRHGHEDHVRTGPVDLRGESLFVCVRVVAVACADDDDAREVRGDPRTHCVQDLARRAQAEDAIALLVAAAEDAHHQVDPRDPLRERAAQQTPGPDDGRAVGEHEIGREDVLAQRGVARHVDDLGRVHDANPKPRPARDGRVHAVERLLHRDGRDREGPQAHQRAALSAGKAWRIQPRWYGRSS